MLQRQQKQKQKLSCQVTSNIPDIVSAARNCIFRIMTSSYRKIAIFLCPSLARLIQAGLYKGKKNYESKHTDVPSWLRVHWTAAITERAGMMIGPETSLARGKLQYIPRYTEALHAFQGSESHWRWLPKHPSHEGEVADGSRSGTSGRGRLLVTFKAAWLRVVTADEFNELFG